MTMRLDVVLKERRNARGWSLREQAAKAEMSHSYLSQVESGKIKQPSPWTLNKIARAYELEYDMLMGLLGYHRLKEGDAPPPPVVFQGEDKLTPHQRRVVQQVIDCLVEGE